MTHQKIPDARDIDGEGLIIREGHRYQDRNGDVHGPIRPSGDRQYPWEDSLSSWTEDGRWIGSDDDSEFDLIAEVAPPSPAAVEHVERGEEAADLERVLDEANLKILISDLEPYEDRALGSLRIDMKDVRSILALYRAALRSRTVTRTGDR